MLLAFVCIGFATWGVSKGNENVNGFQRLFFDVSYTKPTTLDSIDELSKTFIDKVSNSRGLANKAFFRQQQANSQWLFKSLDSLGFEPSLQTHKLPIWQSGKHELEIVPYKSDNFVPFDAFTLPFSKPTTDTSGFLINVGSASDLEIQQLSKELKGNIALFTAPLPNPFLPQINKRLSDALILLKQHGAAGAIIYGTVKGKTIPNLGLPYADVLSNFPCTIIAEESAEEIKKWMGQERLMAFFHARHLISKFEQESIFFQVNKHLKDRVLLFARYDISHRGNLYNTNLYGGALLIGLTEKLKSSTEYAQVGVDVLLCPTLPRNALPGFIEERIDKNTYQALLSIDGIGSIKEFACPARIDVQESVSSLLSKDTPSMSIFSGIETSMRYYGPQPLGKYILQGIPVIQPMFFTNLEQMELIHYSNGNSLLMNDSLRVRNIEVLASFLKCWSDKGLAKNNLVLSKRKLKKWQNKNADYFLSSGLMVADSAAVLK